MSKKNLYKSEIYKYNASNRMKKSEVTDHIKKTQTISHYDYDAFGRRTLVQDENGKLIRTLYDAFSFDIIREQETFADGYFTNTRDTGIQWGKVSEGDGSRYRYISDDGPVTQTPDGYQVVANNRASSSVALYANGKAISQTRSSNNASTERTYFGTDLLGTVRSATRDSGTAQYYDYDVFGKPLGENISDFAYTGKPYDPTTGMYNYGYRDYSPQTARFTTVDPIRDGSNWFVYCNNEPVNWVDEWGLEIIKTKGINGNNFFQQDSYADIAKTQTSVASEGCYIIANTRVINTVNAIAKIMDPSVRNLPPLNENILSYQNEFFDNDNLSTESSAAMIKKFSTLETTTARINGEKNIEKELLYYANSQTDHALIVGKMRVDSSFHFVNIEGISYDKNGALLVQVYDTSVRNREVITLKSLAAIEITKIKNK